ncbi:acetoin utilization protein AcuC [Streptomyces cellulosae]|jgi:acetoin utilization protein AcuC|uniref:Acetoin utilization protein AcuC n=2 Tax=Streptomyces TaxID=1883 RepID=A0ABU3JJE4_9ACTN|nr:acetoin utilization protein AcuC [Streptomyces sp. McG7]MBT2905973.1 acetoin utilization protein AcuC [Streptomyces sp. McG8]MCX4478480.1 acetoin utilization protein AcuC [Streptomyces cellulosae]MDQ0487906.1 acetoin utilization protein AcuC [Streptomyces thermodiastaticus]MDT6974722.1 acetoin utilization protein AcuC [Streptomyces thermocarboxydus]MDX3418203.1 acetoin utilization protein AcuC [Streptomyces sp. MD20-1-1]MXQ58223.1 acetoin utilization protein AcuC [Streptomyces sp. XHT-2]M
MSGRAQLMWDEAVTGYDFGRDHPMDPVRLALTRSLVTALGLDRDVNVVAAKAAGESTLRLVHREDYIDAVRAASADPGSADQSYGLGTVDDPAFAGMHEVSALIAGQSVGAAEAVWRGEALHAVNFAGGLHHAMPGAASGFCVYNDAALAIARLLELGAERVAYIDVDVHHGDGVQAAFWEDPRVLTISLHEHPRTLFPQTGWPEETGAPNAEGSAVNVALPAGTGDAGWLRAFHAVVPELIADFRPQVLVTQHGADTHFEDPLAHLAVSLDAQRAVQVACHDLAHEHAEGRWVALGGGGYAVVEVVPRSWAHLVAIAAGRPVEPTELVPDEWRRQVYARTRQPAPHRMTDGRWPVPWAAWDEGYDPADRLDQAILATRRAVFPLRGLLP